MPKLSYSEPKTFELWPVGEYVGKVTACDSYIQQGGKTTGSDVLELTILFTRTNPVTKQVESKEVNEMLIFHPSCDWKITAFMLSFNLLINGESFRKGMEVEMTMEEWVQASLGLRGWATLGIEEYKSTRDNQMKKINRIVAFLTNKEKFEKEVQVDPAAAATSEDDGF